MTQVLGRFEVRGVLYSKKNSSNIAVINGKPMVLGNPKFNATKDNYKEQILSTCPANIEGPVTLHLRVWGNNEKWLGLWNAGHLPEKYAGWDFDNKTHSACDLLTYAGVLFDDCQIQEAHIRKMHGKGLEGADGASYGCQGFISRFEETEWPS